MKGDETGAANAPPRAGGAAKPGRDLRLDFFRGVALIFIFLNHIPQNVAAWVSNRNYGFSDATEIFVFVSGYSAVLAYGAILNRQGATMATLRILRRTWQVYTAHILLFVVFVAQIAWIAERYNNPLFTDEMRISPFLDEPHVVLIQVLLLRSKPTNMDVLPLYVILLLFFPLVLVALRRARTATLLASFALYVAALALRLNLGAYPSGEWFFNPLAWQFLFIFGAWCGSFHGQAGPWRAIPSRLALAAAIAYLVFSLWVVCTWNFPQAFAAVPHWLAVAIYPINKTYLDPLRLLHFVAVAYVTVMLVRPDAAFLRARPVQPVLRCGQHSLEIFCLGIFLSFLGHFVLVEVDGSALSDIAVSAAGVAIMIAVAYALTWYDRAERRPPTPAPTLGRPTTTDART
ncbi:MAG: OpgC family protein [Rhodospirillales bacterium]